MNARAVFFALTASLPAISFNVTAPAAEPERAVAGDLARIQGCWTAKAGARRELKVMLQIEGRTVQVRIATPRGSTIRAQGELRLDELTTPRSLDWLNFRVAGQESFPDIPAIYALRGETLTICNGGPSGIRPSEFKAGDGVLADLLTFERATEATPAGPESRKTTRESPPAPPETNVRPSEGGKP
jgi:uncharacterized protein (TIGR03067 family)